MYINTPRWAQGTYCSLTRLRLGGHISKYMPSVQGIYVYICTSYRAYICIYARQSGIYTLLYSPLNRAIWDFNYKGIYL